MHRRYVGMLCLDLTCAFDCVQHDSLLYKMSLLRFPLYLLKVVASFLKDCRFRVAIGRTGSSTIQFVAGVPQESVILSTLFNIYVHDIPVPVVVVMAQLTDDSAYNTASHRTSTIERRLQLAANRVTSGHGVCVLVGRSRWLSCLQGSSPIATSPLGTW